MRQLCNVFIVLFGTVTQSFSQQDRPCCTVIDLLKDSGLVTIRDHQNGFIQQFRPDALQLAEINVGDSIRKSADRKAVSITGARSAHPLSRPSYGLPCCTLSSFEKTGNTYRVTATGKKGSIQFSVPDSLASTFSIVEKIYTTPSHGYAMVLKPATGAAGQLVFIGFPLLPDTQPADKQR